MRRTTFDDGIARMERDEVVLFDRPPPDLGAPRNEGVAR